MDHGAAEGDLEFCRIDGRGYDGMQGIDGAHAMVADKYIVHGQMERIDDTRHFADALIYYMDCILGFFGVRPKKMFGMVYGRKIEKDKMGSLCRWHHQPVLYGLESGIQGDIVVKPVVIGR